jgi:hypothetical protein
MRMKKRGILLGNVTNIIIAVLGLLVFGFFVIQVYKLYVNQESTNAKNMLDMLSAKIEALNINESSEILLQGFKGGENWALVGWGKNEGEKEGKPDKCFGKTCLCVCNSVTAREQIGPVCQESGNCKFFETSELSIQTILDPPTQIQQPDGTWKTISSKTEYIKLSQTLFSIQSKKEENKIILESTVKGETIFTPATGANKQ